MLPQFPKFKPLEQTDRKAIAQLAESFPPYSDFNFVSLWTWNVTEQMSVSNLNGNLAVKFNDYVTGEMFYSFLGNTQVSETASVLIRQSVAEGLPPKLMLVPEHAAQLLDPTKFQMVETREHFDYVVSVERLLPHDGTDRPLSSRRRLIKKFKESVPCEIKQIDVFDEAIQYQIDAVFREWEKQVDADECNTEHLRTALNRMFKMEPIPEVISFGAYVNGELAGYCINELCAGGYVVGHFQQGNLKIFPGIYALLMHDTSPYFHDLGYKYINLEQDLNILGLRTWKLSHHPAFFLKKFEVSVCG